MTAEPAYQLQTTEQEIKNEVSTLMETATTMTVTTTQEAEGAVMFNRGISDSIKKVKEFFKPMKEAADAAHKAVVARENETLAIPEQAKQIVNNKLTTFNQEQEQKRREEEARLAEEARKQHEKDLAKAQKKIEALLAVSTDHAETIELLQLELEKPDLTDVERQKLETQLEIERAILENNQEKVEQIHEQATRPVYTPPPVLPKQEKVKGMVTKYKVEMSITNTLAVIKLIATGNLPASCAKLNEAEIKKHILAFKDQKKSYPGINYRITTETHTR